MHILLASVFALATATPPVTAQRFCFFWQARVGHSLSTAQHVAPSASRSSGGSCEGCGSRAVRARVSVASSVVEMETVSLMLFAGTLTKSGSTISWAEAV